MDLISVIIPVYKVEQYLDKCISSVVGQTYKNLEIILVDDGSPDDCPRICDEWAKKDVRVKVIHKANGGLSDARNAGMAIASGELIGFVDSDDWIREDMYQLLLDNMSENDSDISCCGVKMIWDDSTPDRMLTQEGNFVLESDDAMRAVICEEKVKQPVWYKLYKFNLVKDIKFPVGKYHEDVFWTYQAVGAAKRVSVIDEPCYFYRQRGDSIMGEVYSMKRLDALEGKRMMLEYVHSNYPMLECKAKKSLWFLLLYQYQQVLRLVKKDDRRAFYDKIAKAKKSVKLSISDIHTFPIKQRIWYMIGCISFVGACRIRNFLKIGI